MDEMGKKQQVCEDFFSPCNQPTLAEGSWTKRLGLPKHCLRQSKTLHAIIPFPMLLIFIFNLNYPHIVSFTASLIYFNILPPFLRNCYTMVLSCSQYLSSLPLWATISFITLGRKILHSCFGTISINFIIWACYQNTRSPVYKKPKKFKASWCW